MIETKPSDVLKFLGIHGTPLLAEVHDTKLGMVIINPETYKMVLLNETIAEKVRDVCAVKS